MMQLFTGFAATAESCHENFLGFFPTWYQYLAGSCSSPQIHALSDVWLIVAAIIEILLRIAGLAAVIFVMYGGFQYLTSQAEPDAVNKARQTIINALIGLAIAVLASVIVNFIAGTINTN
jgi:ABC-type Fe3+ transport system permease subunit